MWFDQFPLDFCPIGHFGSQTLGFYHIFIPHHAVWVLLTWFCCLFLKKKPVDSSDELNKLCTVITFFHLPQLWFSRWPWIVNIKLGLFKSWQQKTVWNMNAHSATFKYKTKNKRNSFTSIPCESIQMGFYGQKAAEWIPLEEYQNGLIILVKITFSYFFIVFFSGLFECILWGSKQIIVAELWGDWQLRLTSCLHFLFGRKSSVAIGEQSCFFYCSTFINVIQLHSSNYLTSFNFHSLSYSHWKPSWLWDITGLLMVVCFLITAYNAL